MLPTRCPWLRLWLMASRVRSPMASRSHWLTAVMMFRTRRPAGEPVELGDDDHLDFAGIHEREQPRHSGTVQAFGRLASIDDDVEQFRAVDDGHGSNLFGLRIKRNATICLSVGGNTNVTNCFHR